MTAISAAEGVEKSNVFSAVVTFAVDALTSSVVEDASVWGNPKF